MPKQNPIRILALDLSLSSPGAAVVDVQAGKAEIIAVSHVITTDKHDYAVRGRIIESWLRVFIAQHLRKPGRHKLAPYDVVVREKYSGKFGHHSIYTAHVAADRALADFGLVPDTTKPIAQQSVKKSVVGRGKAEKHEVEEAVRRITGYEGALGGADSDEADAVAVALAYAIQSGLIEGIKTEEDE